MLINNLRLAPRLGMCGGIPPFALYAFVMWTGTTLRVLNSYVVLNGRKANELDS